MSVSEFDFEALKNSKFADYKKQYCKATIINKAKAGIILVDYRLSGKKFPCILISFKKPKEALDAFKQLKQKKEHLLKKTGLCQIDICTNEEGKSSITMQLKKGGLDIETLKEKGQNLFEKTLKMTFNVQSAVGAEKADEHIETAANNVLFNRESFDSAVLKIDANLKKIHSAIRDIKIPRDKLQSNLKSCKLSLIRLMQQAKSEDSVDKNELDNIRLLNRKIHQLQTQLGVQKAPTKLSEEQRLKMNNNMDTILSRLQTIEAKLLSIHSMQTV